mgnify:CR=1 FL=1|jgi:hypothetical protein
MQNITINKTSYVSPDSCAFGDYGGAGALGLANIKDLLATTKNILELSFGDISDIIRLNENGVDSIKDIQANIISKFSALHPDNNHKFKQPNIIHVFGDYGSETVYINESKYSDTLEALADYPCIDEETLSQIESDWEIEAFNDYASSDLKNKLPENEQDKLNSLPIEKQNLIVWNAYRQAMEDCNEYPIIELSNAFIDTDKIALTFTAIIKKQLANEDLKQWKK